MKHETVATNMYVYQFSDTMAMAGLVGTKLSIDFCEKVQYIFEFQYGRAAPSGLNLTSARFSDFVFGFYISS